jgi:hypothetical protein
MRQAGRDVCRGLDIGVDADQTLVGGHGTRTSGTIRSGFGTPSCARWRPCRRCQGGRWLEERKHGGSRRRLVDTAER